MFRSFEANRGDYLTKTIETRDRFPAAAVEQPKSDSVLGPTNRLVWNQIRFDTILPGRLFSFTQESDFVGMIATTSGSRKAISIQREMGLTQGEFFRTLHSVVIGTSLKVGNGEALIADGHRKLVIRPSNTRRRRIGSMQLPVTDIEFLFLGFSKAETTEFMARVDLYFRRGGG